MPPPFPSSRSIAAGFHGMIGGLLVLLALPSVCSARSAGDTNGVITLKVFGSALSPSVSLASQTASQRVLHRFQELHPEIQLVSTEGLKIQGQGGDISALMQFAAEIAPDVVGVTFRNVDNYVRQGFLQPIDPFLKEVPAEELRERVPNAAWPAIRRAGPDGADHVWALPCDTRVMGIVFRRSLFKEVGIDPTRGPRDWREFEEYCRKIHAADKTKYGFAFDVGAEESMRLISFIWSAGGVDMVEIAPGQWRAAFDSPGVIEAMMFYYRLVKGGLVYRGSDWAVQWRRGKIAMDLQAFGDALVCDQDPVGFGAAPVPLGPTGQRRNELSCTMMGISARTKDPRTLRAAWEFIRFIDGPESRGIRVRAWLENGMAGKINPRILKQFGFEEYQQDVPPDWNYAHDTALAAGKPEPHGKNANLIYREMSRPMDQMFHDERVEVCWRAGDEAGMKRRIQEIFTEGAKRTNERIMGYIPPATQKFRRQVAAAVVVVVLVAFVFLFRAIWRVFSPQGRGGGKALGWNFRRYWFAYLMMVPALGTILIWHYLPLLRGSVMAFQEYRIMGGSRWVGLDNFAQVLFEPGFWNALWVTCQFSFWCLSLGFFAPVFLAILLQEVPRGKVLYRVLFYLPHMVSGLIVVFLWKSFYASDGLFNRLLGLIGIQSQIGYLSEPSFALIACVLPGIWAGMGAGSLLYLAALKTIPDDLYEASDIDGTTFFQKIRHIVIPSLKPLLVINFVGAFAGSFHSSANILVMTGGGPYTPYGATEVTSLMIYYNAFLYLRFGVATAMAWTLGSMLIGFTVIQLKRLSRMEFRTTEAE